jgi:hypothetical protein
VCVCEGDGGAPGGLLRDCVRLGLAALRWAIFYIGGVCVSSGGPTRERAVASGWRMVLSPACLPAWALLAGTRAMEVCGGDGDGGGDCVGALRATCERDRDGQPKKVGVESRGKGVPVVVARSGGFRSPSRWNCAWECGTDRPRVPGAAGGPVRSGPGQVGLVALGLALVEIQWAWLLPPPVARRRSVGGLPEDEVCSELFLFLSRVRQPVRAPESSKPGWNLPTTCLYSVATQTLDFFFFEENAKIRWTAMGVCIGPSAHFTIG